MDIEDGRVTMKRYVGVKQKGGSMGVGFWRLKV
jgi:hypothetical protein